MDTSGGFVAHISKGISVQSILGYLNEDKKVC